MARRPRARLPRARRPALRPAAALLALAVVAAACNTDDAAAFGTAPVTIEPVVQVISTPASVVARTYVATVRDANGVAVTSPGLASITELLVEDGDEVTAGQRLGRMRSDALTTSLRQAESVQQLAAANERAVRDQLALAESQPVTRPNEFSDRAEEVEALLAEALAEVDRLRASGADDADINAVLVTAQQLRTEIALVSGLRDQVLTAESARIAADQTLAQARAAIGQLTLVAPTDGTVRLAADAAAGAGRTVSVGSDVGPGQTVLTVTTGVGLRLELAVPEVALAPVVEGVRVAIDLEAYPGTTLTGRVDRVVAGPAGGALPGGLADGLGGLGGLADGLGGLGGLAGGLAGLAGGLPLPGDAADGAGSGGFIAEVTLDSDAGLPLRAGLTGTAVLPELAFTDRFEIRMDVDEIDVVLVEVGQSVVVELDALRGVPLKGTIVALAVTPDRSATGGTSYRARVRLDEPEDDAPPLRGGLTGAGDIEVQRFDGPITVPSTALRRRGGSEVVYVVRDGIAVEVAVKVLAFGEARAAIEGDVAEGEQVVTIGVERVEDGTPIGDA